MKVRTHSSSSTALETTSVTATEGLDYEVQTTLVTFPAGSTSSVTFTVPIIDDMVLETTETITISVGNADNLNVNPVQSTTTISIIDDDLGNFFFNIRHNMKFDHFLLSINVLCGGWGVSFAWRYGLTIVGLHHLTFCSLLITNNGINILRVLSFRFQIRTLFLHKSDQFPLTTTDNDMLTCCYQFEGIKTGPVAGEPLFRNLTLLNTREREPGN